jgi:hypothetical protein
LRQVTILEEQESEVDSVKKYKKSEKMQKNMIKEEEDDIVD